MASGAPTLSAGARTFLRFFCMVCVVTGMVAGAELTGEKEIIFPEVAALSCGCFLSPRLVWRTNAARMIAAIAVCALAGVGIVRFLPLPLWAQFTLAFLLGQLVLLFSGTSFTPLISAIALPVLIQTKSPVYIAAAIILTALVCLLRALLVRTGAVEKGDFSALPLGAVAWRLELAALLFRTAAVLLLAAFCIPAGFRFCLAPPLLVAFVGLSAGPRRSWSAMVRLTLLVSLCALSGAGARLLLTGQLGLPLAVSAFFASLLVLLLLRLFSMPFPPAAAMAILAMLIPADSLLFYPLQVAAGIAVLSLLACFWRPRTA